jgi:hypothetical protein
MILLTGTAGKFGFSPPLLLSLIDRCTVCGCVAIRGFSTLGPGETNHANAVYHWTIALFSLSLATNIIVTSLIGASYLVPVDYWILMAHTSIAWRIRWSGRIISSLLHLKQPRQYTRAMVIMWLSLYNITSLAKLTTSFVFVLSIESGAICSIITLIVLITYVSNTNALVSHFTPLHPQILWFAMLMNLFSIGYSVWPPCSDYCASPLWCPFPCFAHLGLDLHRELYLHWS